MQADLQCPPYTCRVFSFLQRGYVLGTFLSPTPPSQGLGSTLQSLSPDSEVGRTPRRPSRSDKPLLPETRGGGSGCHADRHADRARSPPAREEGNTPALTSRPQPSQTQPAASTTQLFRRQRGCPGQEVPPLQGPPPGRGLLGTAQCRSWALISVGSPGLVMTPHTSFAPQHRLLAYSGPSIFPSPACHFLSTFLKISFLYSILIF